MKISGKFDSFPEKNRKIKGEFSPEKTFFKPDRVSLGNEQSNRAGLDNKQISKKFNLTASQVKKVFDFKGRDAISPTLWTYKRDADSGRDFVASENQVWLADGGRLKQLDRNGKPVLSVNLKSPLVKGKKSIWQADGVIVAATEDNQICGIDPDNGKVAWNFSMGAKFKNPVKIADDGSVLTFKKEKDHLYFYNLNPDGTVKSKAELGMWSEPIGDDGSDAVILGQDTAGNTLAHASVKVKKPGEQFTPTYNKTFSISPDGKIKWDTRNLEVPEFYPGANRMYMVDYEKSAGFDTQTGNKIWSLDKKHTGYDPKIGPYGDTLFEIGGQHKYKYIKFVNCQADKLIIQGYIEGPLRKTKSGEELLCVNRDNPNQVYWRKHTEGSVFTGPIYADDNLILHVKNEERGVVEALDPETGKPRWEIPLKDSGPGSGSRSRVVGKQKNFVVVSQEDPNNYQVKQAPDGSLLIRTYSEVFNINPSDGSINCHLSSKHELGDFQVNRQGDVIIADDLESNELAAFPVSEVSDQISISARKIKEQEDEPQPEPRIEVGDKEVNIGGVVLKKNR